jgi:hypothetical protein
MPSQEEIDQQQELLTTYRRTLAHLLQQAAQYGGEAFTPPQTANGIHEARTNIQHIKQMLRGWGVSVDDHSDDEIENGVRGKPVAYRYIPGVDLSSREAQHNILYASNIIDAHVEELERRIGIPDTTDMVNVGSLEEIPQGGIARDYTFNNYILSISYDRQGIAKSVRIEGLSKHGYKLYDWFQVLHRLGISIGPQPDVIGIMSATWRNYHGYNITVALDKVDGVINIVRVFKVPEQSK